MGVFDYLEVRVDLPEAPSAPPAGHFQTKDTPDQYRTRYWIAEDGALMWRPYRFEEVPAGERRWPDPTHPLHAVGSQRRVHGEPEVVDYTGALRFYTLFEDHLEWWEFEATLEAGRVLDIDLVEHRCRRECSASAGQDQSPLQP